MVDRGVEGRRGEEAVVQEGAFEDQVDEEVEGVPDEEDSQAQGRVGGEGAPGELVGDEEEGDDGEEGDGCCLADGWWGGSHGCARGCGF